MFFTEIGNEKLRYSSNKTILGHIYYRLRSTKEPLLLEILLFSTCIKECINNSFCNARILHYKSFVYSIPS